MKQLIKESLRKLTLFFLFSFSQLLTFAQEATQSTTTTTRTTTQTDTWYMQPWAWVVGGVLLLLLLIALFKGNSSQAGRTDKVVVTKTVRQESDVD